jgi:hypothetical protein
VAYENEAVMKEFLISSQKVPALLSQEHLSKKAGKELPGHDEDSWQYLYRFPNGLGASMLRSSPRSSGERETTLPGWQSTAEVSIIQWNGDRWKPLPDTNRRVLEADLGPYLRMIRDIPPEDVARLTE